MPDVTEHIKQMAEARRHAIERLPWSDANLWLGPAEGFPLAAELPVGELIAQATRFGIRSGLISHWRSKTVAPQVGNAALAQLAPGLPKGFFTVLTGLPLIAGDAGPLPGTETPPPWVKGVRIFPKTHEFAPTPWCVGGLCEWLVAHVLPLFVWHTELQWAQLYDLAQAFPRLSIVVESQPLKIIYHVRTLWGVMQACPNVSAEASNLANPAFRWLLDTLGPERFVFGSFLPINDPLVAMGMLIDSGLSERDQALVAGGNLQRLIGEELP